MKKIKLSFIPTLALFFILFPVLTTDEIGSMGIMVWGGLLVLSILYTINEKKHLPNWTVWALMMWFLGMMSSAMSPYSIIGNDGLKYLAFVLLYVLLSNYKYEEKDFYIAFYPYTVLSMVLAGLIILSFIYGYAHVDSVFEGQIRFSIGITGIYKNPNYIGSFINVSAFILLNIVFFKKISVIKKVIIVFIIGVILFSILLTGTRAALLTFIIGVILSLLSYYRFHKISFTYFVPFLILLFVLIVYSDQILDYYENRFLDRGSLTDNSRTYAWSWAMSLIKEAPIMGYGINSWDKLHKFGMIPGLHNIILEFFLNQGSIGISLLFYLMFRGMKKVKETDRLFVLGFCLITTFPILFQNGLIDITLWRVMLMNRIVMDYSAYSNNGIMALFLTPKIENKWIK